MVEPRVEPIMTPQQFFHRLKKNLRFCVFYGGTSTRLGEHTRLCKSSGRAFEIDDALLVSHHTDHYMLILTAALPVSLQILSYTPATPTSTEPPEYHVCGMFDGGDSFDSLVSYVIRSLDISTKKRRSDVRPLFVPEAVGDAV